MAALLYPSLANADCASALGQDRRSLDVQGGVSWLMTPWSQRNPSQQLDLRHETGEVEAILRNDLEALGRPWSADLIAASNENLISSKPQLFAANAGWSIRCCHDRLIAISLR
jgi:hypothetical protein